MKFGMLCNQPADHQIKVRRLPRVIETPGGVHLAVAGAKHEHVSAPSNSSRLLEQSVRVLRVDLPLEPVQDEQVWRAFGDRAHPHERDMVPVRGCDPFQAVMDRGNSADHLAPDRGEMRTGKPPGWFEARGEFWHGLDRMWRAGGAHHNLH